MRHRESFFFATNQKIKTFYLTVLLLIIVVFSLNAELVLTVGYGETHTTISAALTSITQPWTQDIRIRVRIPADAYTEAGLSIDNQTINMDGHQLTFEGISNAEVTWYVGDDIEFNQNGSSMEIIENITGSDLIARRTHTGVVSSSAEEQYFIKNHLGSTVTLIDKVGSAVGPVFDYFPYGKQKEVVVAPENVTQTFTGKELDLFEKDIADGEDGEGWYYFGARFLDPDLGIWISCDPVDEFWNSYAYGPGNPLNGTDKKGRYWVVEHSVYAKGGLTGATYRDAPVEKYYTLEDQTAIEYFVKGEAGGMVRDNLLSRIPIFGKLMDKILGPFNLFEKFQQANDLKNNTEKLFDARKLPENKTFKTPEAADKYAQGIADKNNVKMENWGTKATEETVIDPNR